MVEGTGLENRQQGDLFVGSNPTLSAIYRRVHLWVRTHEHQIERVRAEAREACRDNSGAQRRWPRRGEQPQVASHPTLSATLRRSGFGWQAIMEVTTDG